MRFKITAKVEPVERMEKVVTLLKRFAGEAEITAASYQNKMFVSVGDRDIENIRAILDLMLPEVRSYIVEPV